MAQQNLYTHANLNGQHIINGGFEKLTQLPSETQITDGRLVYIKAASGVTGATDGYYYYDSDSTWKHLVVGSDLNLSTTITATSNIGTTDYKLVINGTTVENNLSTTADINSASLILKQYSGVTDYIQGSVALDNTHGYISVNNVKLFTPSITISDITNSDTRTVVIKSKSNDTESSATISLVTTPTESSITLGTTKLNIPQFNESNGTISEDGTTYTFAKYISIIANDSTKTFIIDNSGKFNLSPSGEKYVVLENGYIPNRYIPGSVDELESIKAYMSYVASLPSISALTINDNGRLFYTTSDKKVYECTVESSTGTITLPEKTNFLVSGSIYCDYDGNNTSKDTLYNYDGTNMTQIEYGATESTPNFNSYYYSTDKIYVDIYSGKAYRWVWLNAAYGTTGGYMVEISKSLVIGNSANQAASGLLVQNIINGSQTLSTNITNTPTAVNDLTNITIGTHSITDLFQWIANTVKYIQTNTTYLEYVYTPTTGKTFTIPKNNHNCGLYPIVQVEVNGQVAILDIKINHTTGDITIDSNVDITPTIKICGNPNFDSSNIHTTL